MASLAASSNVVPASSKTDAIVKALSSPVAIQCMWCKPPENGGSRRMLKDPEDAYDHLWSGHGVYINPLNGPADAWRIAKQAAARGRRLKAPADDDRTFGEWPSTEVLKEPVRH